MHNISRQRTIIIDVQGESSLGVGDAEEEGVEAGTNKGLKSWERVSGSVGSEVMTLIRVQLDAAAAACGRGAGG